MRKARKSAQAYFRMYMEDEPVSQLVKSTAGVMQEYTQSGGVRPFGVSLLVAGCDADGTPRLYQVDPSGAYFGWKATAIGKVCRFPIRIHYYSARIMANCIGFFPFSINLFLLLSRIM